jgi:hypothetical protein
MTTRPSPSAPAEALREKFQRLLSAEPFTGLKAILDKLSADPEVLFSSVQAATSYDELLRRLGYRITLTNQIHVQDCYARLGPAGGIKAVLPYYDIPTQSSLPTLVNFDSTVTATHKSAAFFNELFAALKAQLSAQK